MTDLPPPDEPGRIELPPSRLPANAPSAGGPNPGGMAPGGPPRRSRSGAGGSGPGTRRRARRRGLTALGAVVVVLAVLVGLAMGPLRAKLRSAFGDNPTTTTVPGPTAVPIPPGFRLANIINRLHAAVPSLSVDKMHALLTNGTVTSTLLPAGGVPPSQLPKNGSALEGLLMPSTWAVPHGGSELLALNDMVAGMQDETTQLGIAEAANRLKLSPYQIMIVASMVQAEAGNPDEAPKIARVIYNRLARNEPLGIDATSKYLKCVTTLDVQVCQAPLTTADFRVDSPYNTRTHRGLPPTPIGAPGESALRAAMNPAEGPWRFYVRSAQNDAQGRPQHVFFADNTSSEYFQAVAACKATKLGC